ncbi:hypothetical protein CN402_14075 [Bacillus sp. AFS015896]|nr:hypothetical protein CN402_14075 [Bacillus sp. AFS015896]
MSKSAEEPPLPPLEIVLDPVLLLFRVRVSGVVVTLISAPPATFPPSVVGVEAAVAKLTAFVTITKALGPVVTATLKAA